MTIAEAEQMNASPRMDSHLSAPAPSRPPRDLQRTFLLVLATVWLLDALLQLQPFMFTPGRNGFSGMLSERRGRESELDRSHDHMERMDRRPSSGPDQYVLRADSVLDRLWHHLDAYPQVRSSTFHRVVPGRLVVRRGLRWPLLRSSYSVRRWPGWCALLRGPCGAAVAERPSRPDFRGRPKRGSTGGQIHLAHGVGHLGSVVTGRGGSFASSTPRSGGRLERSTAGVARPHRPL